MASDTQAKRIQKQVQKILSDKGLTITRTRPPIGDDLEEEIITVKGFLNPINQSQGSNYSDMGGIPAGLQDGQSILFDTTSDVNEGDILTFSDIDWRCVRKDNTFLGDTQISFTMIAQRKGSASWMN